MKLTKRQFKELLNQHTGTGYIILKTNNNTVHIADIGINRNGTWYIGLGGRLLAQGLKNIAKEVIYD